jgi:uncharacterized damage-inducible protein DinB
MEKRGAFYTSGGFLRKRQASLFRLRPDIPGCDNAAMSANIPLPAPLPTALASLRARITAVFPAQVREAVSKLSDEQLWWRPNESSNSVGNLVLHLSGSLNHYLNRNLGGIEFDRNREQEFAERRSIPRAELRAVFDGMVANAGKTFDGLTVERLGDASPEPRQSEIVVQDLINIAVHFSTHTGQILWITKMLSGASMDDLWMRAHREGGGWRPR